MFMAFKARGFPGSTQSGIERVATVPMDTKVEPNISARDAYFLILADSVWKRQQLATTIITNRLRLDWLEFR